MFVVFILACQNFYPQELNTEKISELVSSYEEGASFSGVVLLTVKDSKNQNSLLNEHEKY